MTIFKKSVVSAQAVNKKSTNALALYKLKSTYFVVYQNKSHFLSDLFFCVSIFIRFASYTSPMRSGAYAYFEKRRMYLLFCKTVIKYAHIKNPVANSNISHKSNATADAYT